jgi:hypothetical protein
MYSMRSMAGTKKRPAMRNIREDRAPQQNVFHPVQGRNQRQGPPCGIYERIETLFEVVPCDPRRGQREGPSYGRKETIGPLLKVFPYNTESEPNTGPCMWNIRENRASAMLFHAVQDGNQRQGPPCGKYERIESLILVVPRDPGRGQRQGPPCGIYKIIGALSNGIPCGPGRKPKRGPFIWEKRKNITPSQSCSIRSRAGLETGPSMRNIRENRAPQQNVGRDQREGPPYGRKERIGPLSNVIPCGPWREPKTGPSMRDTEENRAP